MKKGVLDQMLLYILALFIAALILFYGYKAITSLQHRAEEIALVRFEKSLQAKIENLASQYESIRIEELDVPQDVKKVCFADKNACIGGNDAAGLCTVGGPDYNAIIKDAITSKTDNVFMIPTYQNLNIKKIVIFGGTLCINNVGGRIKLKLTGMGDGTQIERYQAETQSS